MAQAPDSQVFLSIRCRSLPASIFGPDVTHTAVTIAQVNDNGSLTELDQTERLRDLANPAYLKQLAVRVKSPAQRFRFLLHSQSGAKQAAVAEMDVTAEELTADLEGEMDSMWTSPDERTQQALIQSSARIIVRSSTVHPSVAFTPEQEKAILSEGRNVFVYNPDGSATIMRLKYKPGFHNNLGSLVWGAPDKPANPANEVQVSDITDILEGKQSRALMQHAARDVEEETAFSIVSSSTTRGGVSTQRYLDVSTESTAIRDVFLNHLHTLLTQAAGKDVSVMEKINVVRSPTHKAPPPQAALGVGAAMGGSFLTPAAFRARQGTPSERQLTIQARNLGAGFNSLVAVFDKQGSDLLYIDQTEVIKGQRDPNFKRSIYVQYYPHEQQEYKVCVYEASEEDMVEAVIDLRQREVVGFCIINADELVHNRASLQYLTHTLEHSREWLQTQKTHVVVRSALAEGGGSHNHGTPLEHAFSKRDIHVRPSSSNLLLDQSRNNSRIGRQGTIIPAAPGGPGGPKVVSPVDFLKKGQEFMKFPHKATLIHDPEPRRVFYMPDPKGKKLGHIYWCHTGRNVMVKERSISIKQIVDILPGKQTGAFRKGATARAVSEKRCFSVIAGARTLDLAAPNEQIRDSWVSALNQLREGGAEMIQRPIIKKQERDVSEVKVDSRLKANGAQKIPQRQISVRCRHLIRAHGRPVNPTVVVFDAHTGDSLARTERLVNTENPNFFVPLVVPYHAGTGQTLKFAVYDSNSEQIEATDLIGHAEELLDDIITAHGGDTELQLINDHHPTHTGSLQVAQSSIIVRLVGSDRKLIPQPVVQGPPTPAVARTVMQEGRPFTMFTGKGPQIVDVYHVPAKDMGALFYADPQKRDNNRHQMIALKDILELFEGKQRDGLNQKLTKGAVEEHFWSVVSGSGGTWDLEAATTYDRDCFLDGLHSILSDGGVANSVLDANNESAGGGSRAEEENEIQWSLLRNCPVTVYSSTGGQPQRGSITYTTTGPSEARLGWIIASLASSTVRIPLHEVTDLFEGRQTASFSYAPASKAVDDHCFSVEAQKDILDIETASKRERDSWVAGLHSVLTGGGKKFADMQREEAEREALASKPEKEFSGSSSLSVSAAVEGGGGGGSMKAQASPLPDGPRYSGTPLRIHATVKCKGLIKMDFLSKSDPLVAVNDVYTGRLLAQTEWLEDTFDPEFETALPLDYYRDQDQLLKFVVYDVDNNQITENGRMGYAIVNMDELMSQPNGRALEKQLTFPEKPQLEKKLFLKASTIIISVEQ